MKWSIVVETTDKVYILGLYDSEEEAKSRKDTMIEKTFDKHFWDEAKKIAQIGPVTH